MRPKKISIIFVGILIGALLFVAYHASRTRRETDSQCAAAQQDQVKLRRELQTAERTKADAENQNVTLQATLVSLKTKSAPTPAPKRTGPISVAAVHANNPQLANLWIAAQKAHLNQDYGPLFRSLRLSPEQTEQLKAIMAHQITADQDIEAAALAKGLEFQDPVVKTQLRQTDDEAKAAEAALLGPDGFRQLQEYQRSMTARGMVDGLAGVVAFTDPLTTQQANKLTAILANASQSYRVGKYADLNEVDWSVVDEQARSVLRPAQFAAWQQGDPRDLRGGQARSNIQLQNAYDKAIHAEKAGETTKP
jgi:hypothetical protein